MRLAAVLQAHALMESNQHVGKIVLTWVQHEKETDCRKLEDEWQPGCQRGACQGACSLD
jgi:hypothetical protein